MTEHQQIVEIDVSSTIADIRSTSRAAEPRKAALVPIFMAMAIVGLLYVFSPNFRPVQGPDASPYAGDFLQEWIGGYLVWAGDQSRFYDPSYAQTVEHDAELVGFAWSQDEYLPLVYPPFYYLLVSPLSFLPVPIAAWIWGGLMSTCFAAAAVLLGGGSRRLLACKGSRFALLPWILPAAALYVPLLESLSSSQKGSLCLLILSGTFLLLNDKRPFLAGLVFGLLAFKPQLTLVLGGAMLLKCQWRFGLGSLVTGLVLLGLSLLTGLDVCLQYVHFSTGAADYLQTAGYDLHKSHCLYGFFALLLDGLPSVAVKTVTLLAAGGTVYVLARLLRGPLLPGSHRFTVQYSALILATVLLSPHLFTYDLTILLLPMFLLVLPLIGGQGRLNVQQRRLLVLVVLLYALPGVSTTVAASTGVQLTVPVMAVLLVLLMTQSEKKILLLAEQHYKTQVSGE